MIHITHGTTPWLNFDRPRLGGVWKDRPRVVFVSTISSYSILHFQLIFFPVTFRCKSIIKKSVLPSPGDPSMTGPAFTWQSYGDSFQPRLSSAEIIHGIPANNEQEVIPFSRFTLNRIYLVEPGLEKRVVEKPIGHKRRAIDGVLKAALESLNRERDGLLRYTTMEFLEGIFRTVPGLCEYYELYFRDLESTQYRKLTLIQAFSPPTIVSNSVARVRLEIVHLIIPLSGRIGKFQKFVGRLLQIYSSNDNMIHVTVVYFGIPGLEKIRSIVSNVKSKYNFAHINVLPMEGNFSRGVALQAGADSLKSPDNDVLMFFCDVDIVFTTDFLERCRLNTEAGKRVYYPILFSLYNPQMVYTLQGQKDPRWPWPAGDILRQWLLEGFRVRNDVPVSVGFSENGGFLWGHRWVGDGGCFVISEIRAEQPPRSTRHRSGYISSVAPEALRSWPASGSVPRMHPVEGSHRSLSHSTRHPRIPKRNDPIYEYN